MRKFLAIAALGCVAAASYGQDNLSAIQIGVTAGWFIPTGSVLRDAFGSQIFTFGVTPVATGRPSSGSFTPSFNIIGADKDGNNFLLIPVTLGYEYHFGQDSGSTSSSSTVPYLRVEAGAAYYNYSIFNASGSTLGWVADAELGVSISSSIKLSAKYYLFQQQQGISFNGLQIGVTFGLFHL